MGVGIGLISRKEVGWRRYPDAEVTEMIAKIKAGESYEKVAQNHGMLMSEIKDMMIHYHDLAKVFGAFYVPDGYKLPAKYR